MWFEELTGFVESSPAQVRANLRLEGDTLHSTVNGNTFTYGSLTIPTLAELRAAVEVLPPHPMPLEVEEWVGNVREAHQMAANAGALFQVASQFNLLEMVGPSVTPEQGVGIYEHDRTQGPACAIAAGAGTIYRNYFVPVNGRIGQTADNQVDCLHDLGEALGNKDERLWRMQNGYVLPTRSSSSGNPRSSGGHVRSSA